MSDRLYFPILRSKRFEMMALRQLAPEIAASKILPIIEPVTPVPTLSTSFDTFLEHQMRFALVVNPIVPLRSARYTADEVFDGIFETYFVDSDDGVIAALYVDEQTTSSQVQAFVQRCDDLGVGTIYLLRGDPRKAVLKAILGDDSRLYVGFVGNVSGAVRAAVPHQERVLIEDHFRKRNNADYPPQDFFCDHGRTMPDEHYRHFGDFSIVGDIFQEGGARPYAVALHHMRLKGEGADLFLNHYVSDSNATQADTAGKFLEAVAKLVADLPNLGVAGTTSASDEYRHLYQTAEFPNLGHLKRLAIKQHLEVLIAAGHV